MPIGKKFSDWTNSAIKKAPEKSGIYEIGGNHPHQENRTIYIGKSDAEDGIRSRLIWHKNNHYPSANGFRYRLVENAGSGLWYAATYFLNSKAGWPRVIEEYHLRKWDDTEEETPIRNTQGPSLTVPHTVTS